MDRANHYAGQIVSQTEMDQDFTDVQNMELSLAAENGLCQAKAAATPSSAVFGGITVGLNVIAVTHDDHVSVALGTCRDDIGTRIPLAAAGTVMMTKAGDCTEGDETLAIPPAGALIVGSCPAGNRIVASLFIVADEHLSQLVCDETGTWLYYRIQESFHFRIEIGPCFLIAAVPVANPGAALGDGKVLLADILLEENAGTVRIVDDGAGNAVIGMCSQDWDVLAGNYALWLGRRSDHFVSDSAAEASLLEASGQYIRVDDGRAATRMLIQFLDQQTYPDGAAIIGSAAQAGGADVVYAAYSTFSIAAGNLHDQLDSIRRQINAKAAKGGDTIKPVGSQNGFTFNPETLDPDKALINIQSRGAAGSNPAYRLGKKRGQIRLPHLFRDDFMYNGTASGFRTVLTDGATGCWRKFVVSGGGGGGDVFLRNHLDGAPWRGGILELLAMGVDNDHSTVRQGVNIGSVQMVGGWDCGAAPFAALSVRIWTPSVTEVAFRISLQDPLAASLVAIDYDTDVHTALRGMITTVGGGGGTTYCNLVDPPVPGTWYTIDFATLTSASAVFNLNNGPEVPLVPGGGTLASSAYYLEMECWTRNAAGGAKWLLVDWINVSDAQLEADMV